MTRHAYLQELNPSQRTAVEHFEGPLLVLAGAGSGKTRVLTARAARLVEEYGVPPDRILALTFTNRAAAEMRDRIRALLGESPAGLWAGTFHSFGAWLLRRHAERIGWTPRFSIYDAEESLEQVERTMEALEIDAERHPPRAVKSEIESAKHWLVTPEIYDVMVGPSEEPRQQTARRVYASYQEALRRQDALDFGDLLMKVVELLREHQAVLRRYRRRFAFLLVDEYQDTNHAQYRLVRLLGERHRNVMVVGDDDQSIYGWRGADLRNILEFEEDFQGCRTVRLERNYRSTSNILAAANAVIRHNEGRKDKTLFTELGAGEPVRVVRAGSDREEARWIAAEIGRRVDGDGREGEDPDGTAASPRSYRDFAVLYRTNAQSRALEDAIRRRGIPYQIVGGVRFYERREIRDVLAYLRLVANPRDRAAFERAVNRPRRGIGEVTRSRLLARAREKGIPPLEAARRATEAETLPPAGARSLERFAALVDALREQMDRLSAADLLGRLLEELELLERLREEGPEGRERAENVQELVAAAAEVDRAGEPPAGAPGHLPSGELTPLDRFLQEVALVAEVDRHDPGADAVSLMTLHNSKGLEFPCVFLAGMEEGLCPHARSLGSKAELEEERRLFYVGLTRAKRLAWLTFAETRRRFGRESYSMASTFLEELPEEPVEVHRADRDPEPPGPRDGDGSVEPDAPSGLPYDPGDRVEHPRFGPGRVVETSGSAADPRVVVDFEEGGRKRLAARYARLERIGE